MSNKTPPAVARGGGRPLADIDTWLFDLDNTLYPLAVNLFAQVEERMGDFIADELEITIEDAHRLRKDFFARHGTTLRGLMLDHQVEPTRFLDYVHDIDLSGVPRNPALVKAINGLPGRKLVFTNATVRHAERVMDRIGLTGHIEAIHDIVASEYLPKPHPNAYSTLVKGYGITPQSALFVEDMARNLQPAAALGMTTAWVDGPLEWARIGSDQAYVHYVVTDLAAWLASVVPVKP